MKKELGYLLVGFSLLTGNMMVSEVGNALILKNDTTLTITVVKKDKKTLTVMAKKVQMR